MSEKRTIRATIIAETTLDNDAMREAAGCFAQDLTKACLGRLAVTVEEVTEAREVWQALNLPERPASNAVRWTPKRSGS